MTRPTLHVYATLWSLRGYPSAADEWSWPQKFAAIVAAGFTGIMSPLRPELAARGALDYWAIGSLGVTDDPVPFFTQAAALGSRLTTIQLCDVDTPLAEAVATARRVVEAAQTAGLPVAIESHRDTCTETPERMWALYDAYLALTGDRLPVCFDHSHFAVVRHLAAPYWPRLNERPDILNDCAQFHLRPFTGHHCQIPATFDGVRRTPEYAAWGEYVRALFTCLQREGTAREVYVVPELGHAAPAYGLSCFPDVWVDAGVVGADLRDWWKQVGSS